MQKPTTEVTATVMTVLGIRNETRADYQKLYQYLAYCGFDVTDAIATFDPPLELMTLEQRRTDPELRSTLPIFARTLADCRAAIAALPAE